jgi:hypothetical protein
MIRPDQIPDEVVEALRENILHDCSFKHAIAAALNAWPGAHERTDDWCTPPDHNLILPLTQENNT